MNAVIHETTVHAATQRRVNFLAVAWGINVLAYSIIYPFLLVYLHSMRGFSMSTAGLIFPVMGVAVIIGSPISGTLTDRFGRRLLLIGGPVSRSLCFFLLALMAAIDAPFFTFALLLFFNRLLGGFFENAANAYLTDLVPAAERATAFSKVRVGLNVGWMLGPALGSFLAHLNIPFAFMFLMTALLCFLTGIIAYKFCPAVPLREHEDSDMPSDSFLTVLLHDRSLLYVLIFNLLLYLSVSQYVSTLSIFAIETVKINRKWLGFLYTINGAMVITLLIKINRSLSRVPLLVRIGMGLLLYVAAYLGFALSTRWIHLALGIALMTVGEMISLTSILTLISQMAPTPMIGRYMGMQGLVDGLGWSVGPYFGAILFEYFQAMPLLLWGLLSTGTLIAGCGYLGMAVFNVSLRQRLVQ